MRLGDRTASIPATTAPGYVDSYYSQTATAQASYPVLWGAREAEVCVVGGGLAGLCTALDLAERGKSVALIEARRIAWGASGRNGGFVSPGFSLSVEDLVRRIGLKQAQALYGLSQHGVNLVRERIERYEIADARLVHGRLKVWRHHDPDGLRRTRDLMAERFGVEYEPWDRARVQEALVTRRYFGALHDPRGFHIHPLNYALGLARAAAGRGVRLYEGSPVTALDLERPAKRAVTAQGSVTAPTLVIACGGLIGRLEPALASATLPVTTYVVATEPLGTRLGEAIRTPFAVSDTRLACDYYRAVEGGRVLWGGRITARTEPPSRLAELMLRLMTEVYPQLAGARAESAWPGIMGYARHKMPMIGQLRPAVWYATTFGGHGLATTAMAGDLVAAAIAEGDDRYRLFAPFGLEWAGGPFGPAAAQASYWAYQLRDWLRERRSA